MANELQRHHANTGDTLYAVVRRKSDGQYWNGAAFEALVVANWATYDLTLTETPASSYFYKGDIPAGISVAVANTVEYYQRIGATPAIDDPLLWEEPYPALTSSGGGGGDATAANQATIIAALGVVDDFLDTEIAAIKAKTDNLPASPAGVGSAMTLAADAVNASALAADAVTELQAGLATAAGLATTTGYIDTEVAAIKAKTDLIPASPAAVGSAMTLAADALNAAAVAADAVTELQAGLATAAALNTVDDLLDTEIAAIKAVTDTLTVPPTVAAIRAEMDSASTQLAKLGTPAGASLAADLVAIKADAARMLGLAQDNAVLTGITVDADGRMTGATQRVYNSATNANLNDGSTGLLYTYLITSTYDTSGNLTLYKRVRVA